MQTSLLVLIFVLAVVLAAVVWAQRAAERRRVDQLQELAPMMGFAYSPESTKPGDSGIDAAILAFPLFRHRGAPRIRNLMRARRVDGEELIFDFRYTVSSGKSSHTVEQTVAAFTRQGARLPAFQMYPENVFSKLGQLLGGQDIDFDDNQEFSSRYVLRGDDPDAVRAWFERQAVSYWAERPGWSAEGGGDCLVLYRNSVREKPDSLREWIDEARRAARVLDPH
jgi:hypothetical protein